MALALVVHMEINVESPALFEGFQVDVINLLGFAQLVK
jgi:hypothetical protein